MKRPDFNWGFALESGYCSEYSTIGRVQFGSDRLLETVQLMDLCIRPSSQVGLGQIRDPPWPATASTWGQYHEILVQSQYI